MDGGGEHSGARTETRCVALSGFRTRLDQVVGAEDVDPSFQIREGLVGSNATLIADAGIKIPADFSKAIGAGAHAIMAGKIFAGTDEAPSELVDKEGMSFKVYMGEASSAAKAVRAKNDPSYKGEAHEYVEGAAGLIPYVGSLESVIHSFDHGLRSAMSYSGARTVKDFHEKAIFMQVSQSGQLESTAHGLVHRS